jgi:hypothetical protein
MLNKPFKDIRQFIIDKIILNSICPNRYLLTDLLQIYCFFFEATKEEKDLLIHDAVHELSNEEYPPPTSS